MNVLASLEQRGLEPLPFDTEAERLQVEAACVLLAEDRLTDKAIAAEVSVNVSTITAWKRRPEIAARIKWYREEMATHVYSVGIAQRENRISALADRWKRMHALMHARARHYATDPEAQEIGGDTGLIVREVKVDPKGGKVVTYKFDAALLKEMRETEKQTAVELGQWTEKHANLNVNVAAEGEALTPEQHEAIRKFLTASTPDVLPAPEESDER